MWRRNVGNNKIWALMREKIMNYINNNWTGQSLQGGCMAENKYINSIMMIPWNREDKSLLDRWYFDFWKTANRCLLSEGQGKITTVFFSKFIYASSRQSSYNERESQLSFSKWEMVNILN